jgi:large subunit ribosomal protein L9
MNVVLKQDVTGLGKAGDVVKVKAGYARNFLIPKGFAVPATKSALKEQKSLNQAQEEKEERLLSEARKYAAKTEGKTLTFTAKSGNNRIFGSVTSADIAAKLKSSLKVPVDKRKVLLSENLKELGSHRVQIQFHPKVKAEVTVNIQPEGGQ